MTVAELIDVLKKMPQDAEVRKNNMPIDAAIHDEFWNVVDLYEPDQEND